LNCYFQIEAKVFPGTAAIGEADLTWDAIDNFHYGLTQLLMISADNLVEPLTRIIKLYFAHVFFLNH